MEPFSGTERGGWWGGVGSLPFKVNYVVREFCEGRVITITRRMENGNGTISGNKVARDLYLAREKWSRCGGCFHFGIFAYPPNLNWGGIVWRKRFFFSYSSNPILIKKSPKRSFNFC